MNIFTLIVSLSTFFIWPLVSSLALGLFPCMAAVPFFIFIRRQRAAAGAAAVPPTKKPSLFLMEQDQLVGLDPASPGTNRRRSSIGNAMPVPTTDNRKPNPETICLQNFKKRRYQPRSMNSASTFIRGYEGICPRVAISLDFGQSRFSLGEQLFSTERRRRAFKEILQNKIWIPSDPSRTLDRRASLPLQRTSPVPSGLI